MNHLERTEQFIDTYRARIVNTVPLALAELGWQVYVRTLMAFSSPEKNGEYPDYDKALERFYEPLEDDDYRGDDWLADNEHWREIESTEDDENDHRQ